MRHLRLFENFNKKWRVPLKMPEYLIALKKIGITGLEYERWEKLHQQGILFKNPNIKNKMYKAKYIFLLQGDKHGYFIWVSYEDNLHYVDNAIKIDITQQDLDDWELEHETLKKYNL